MSLLDTASLIVTPNGYKEGKLYSVIPSDGSGDMSVTRATTATRVNSAGLVELVPYNLLSWSQDFTNGWYAYLGSITATANYGTAPDGTNTSTRILFTSNNQIWAKAISGLTNLNGTFSVWIKGVAGQTIAISYGGTDNVVTLQSGWNRYSVTAVGTIDFIFIDTFGSTATDIEVWGGQVVEGSTAKDYQKTETRLNIPRLDYSNGTCPSLLVEPQRTNQLTYSSSFNNAAWEKQLGASVTANTTTAPDGTMSADTLTIAPNQYMYQLQGLSSGTSYTISFYCKVASGTKQFNMVTYSPSGNINYSPTLTATTEWQRFEFTITANATASTSIYPVLVDSFASGSFFIWGAQMEVGSYATSYIPTTSASVTRNADVISKTGISSFFGTNQGTFFCDFIAPSTDSSNTQYIFDVSDGVNGTTNRLAFYKLTSNSYQLFTNTGTTITINANTRNKVAIVWNGTNVKIFANGSQEASITYANTNPSQINLGARFNNVEFGNVFFNASATWPTALSDTQLATLTTL